jgi:hypothetical protein
MFPQEPQSDLAHVGMLNADTAHTSTEWAHSVHHSTKRSGPPRYTSTVIATTSYMLLYSAENVNYYICRTNQ